MLTLLLLMAVSWGVKGQETYSHTIQSKTWSKDGPQILNGITWTAVATGSDYWGYESTKGQQFGKAADPANMLLLSTTDIPGTITSIKVSTSGANSIDCNLSITVGGNNFGTSKAITNSNKVYSFEGSASGEIILRWDQNSSKAIYLKKIEITYLNSTLPLPTLSFDQPNPTIDITQTTSFTNPLSVTLEGVTNIPVTYESSNTSIATVNPNTGDVTAVKFGFVKITAKVAETETYGSASASYDLTITAPEPKINFQELKITKDILEAAFSNLLQGDTTYPIEYTSSKENIASVNQEGLITLHAEGTTIISAKIAETATNHAATATCSLTVTIPTPVMKFTETTLSKDIREEGVINPLTITLYDQPNTELPVGYTSSNPNVAQIDEKGNVSLLSFGTTKITAKITATNLHKAATATYNLTITAPTPTMVFENTAIEKDVRDGSVSNRLSVKIDDIENTEIPVTYSSGNNAIATVDATGVVSFIKHGSTTIKATIADSKTYHGATTSFNLTLTAPTVEMDFAKKTIQKSDTDKDTPITNPLTAILEGKPFTETGATYQSSYSSVAKVDKTTGVVTIAGAGITTITATIADGNLYKGGEASYTLEVQKAPVGLPFSFNGSTTTSIAGLSDNGLGSYTTSTSNTKLKFDDTGDYLLLAFKEKPGNLSFYIKGNSFNGTFTVEESTDGISYTAVKVFEGSASISTNEEKIEINTLKPESRFVRWIYTLKKSGNVGLGNILLDAIKNVATPVFTPEESTFFDSQKIAISSATPNAEIYYTTNNEQPSKESTRYTEPFDISATTTIRAMAFEGEESSYETQKTYTRIYSEVTPNVSAVDFGDVNIFTLPASKSEKITLSAANLRSDLTVSVKGAGFACDQTLIRKEEADGAVITVTYSPNRTDTYTGNIEITGGGLDTPVTIPLTGNTVLQAEEMLLNEDFGFTASITIASEVTETMIKKGWSGEKLYSDLKGKGKIKIGSSDHFGYLTTPTFDLSDPNYLYFISFESYSYSSSDNKNIQVIINGNEVITENINLTLTETAYSYPLPNHQALTVKITGITGTTEKNNRFYLDNIRITKTPRKQEMAITGEATYKDLNARLALESLENITLSNFHFTDEGTINTPANPNCLVFTDQPLGLTQNEVVNGVCKNLVLTDNAVFGSSKTFTASNATYSRQAYQDGGWETIMLPYNVTANEMPADYTFAKFTGVSETEKAVTFTQVTELKAHTPYLMKYVGANPGAGQAACTFEVTNTTIGAQTATANFVGVYTQTNTKGKYILGMKDGQTIFGKGTATSYVNPFRAYLDITLPANTPSLRVIHKPADVTGLEEITNKHWHLWSETPGELTIRSAKPMYLQVIATDGRTMHTQQINEGETVIPGFESGLYFVNGKKVIIK